VAEAAIVRSGPDGDSGADVVAGRKRMIHAVKNFLLRVNSAKSIPTSSARSWRFSAAHEAEV
jgi:hypothetical protein